MIKKVVNAYAGRRVDLTVEVARELGLDMNKVARFELILKNGIVTLEPVEVEVIVKRRKKKKADKREKE